MTGRLMEAEEAAALHIVNHLVERNVLIEKACDVASEFSQKPLVA